MSRNAYARYRGCSLSTVQRAIEDGRIAAAIVQTKPNESKINVEMADQLWIENTDPRRGNNHKGKAHADQLYDPTPKNKDENTEKDNTKEIVSSSYQRSRALKENYAAQVEKVKLDKLRGKLVEKDRVKEYMIKIHSRAKDTLLNIPDKVGPKLAAENDLHKIIEILNKEIQKVCEQFSKGELDF